MNTHTSSATSHPSGNPNAFVFRFRVRYSECDAQGVVFNARYADFVDMASTEFWRALVGGYKALVARGLETQVVSLLINWKSPARFDDVMCARVRTTMPTVVRRYVIGERLPMSASGSTYRPT